MRKIGSLLLALLVVLSLSVPALAEEVGLVSYERRAFSFRPGSLRYPTDLFPELKNVMPGDTLTQQIKLVHNGSKSVNIRLYMKAEGSDKGEDFIRQLRLQVVNKNKEILYKGPAYDATEVSGWISLGTLTPGKSATLDLTLDVPLELDNRYADRLGTVVWKFKAEEIPVDPNAPKTSDDAPLLLWAAALTLSTAALVILMGRRKKQK